MTSMELLVLIVADPGLRSALVGRLSLQGETLVTVSAHPGESVLDRIARAPATLIVDARAAGDGLQAMRESPRWGGVIVLADAAETTPAHERFGILDRADAVNAVGALLERWRLPAALPAALSA